MYVLSELMLVELLSANTLYYDTILAFYIWGAVQDLYYDYKSITSQKRIIFQSVMLIKFFYLLNIV